MSIINYAQEVFRSDGDGILLPRMKYNFTLVFDLAYNIAVPAANTPRPAPGKFTNQPSKVFHRVQSATVPGVSFETKLLNQYNQPRVVQTRMNYDNMTAVFYDTYDNDFHDMMTAYIAHSYNNHSGIDQRTILGSGSTITPVFLTDMGFTPSENKNFFPKVKLIQNGYRDQFRTTALINPTIISITGDSLSYSESLPVLYTVVFQPESIQTYMTDAKFDDNINTDDR
jgi:hypothetical protein